MSKLPYEFFIARRYLQARRKAGFINLITYISIVGVAIGVAALVIVLSVMNGFESEVRSRIIGFDAHIRIKPSETEMDNYQEIMDKVQNIPHIIGVSPYIHEKAILRSGKRSDAVFVRGADLASLGQVSDLEKNILDGSLDFGPVPWVDEKELPGIVLGWPLGKELNVVDTFKTVFLISMKNVRSMFQAPPVKQFVVTGFFETGFYEYDRNYVYISNETAQELYDMGHSVSGIEIKLDDLYRANSVSNEIKKKLIRDLCYTSTWFESWPNLFSWMKIEKWAMFIVLCLIILVAAFNIISTLIMVVMEKTREIGILKSMGATSRSITRIFLYEGMFVGIVGTLSGLVFGIALCVVQQVFKPFSLPGDVYFINVLPVKMDVMDIIMVAVTALIICIVAAIYPARKASKMVPVEAIRYE
jgi:lipoprotein-releasing system permease protein